MPGNGMAGISAHYDGTRVLLDEAVKLRPSTRLIVTVLDETDRERQEFLDISARALGATYADDEVKYPG